MALLGNSVLADTIKLRTWNIKVTLIQQPVSLEEMQMQMEEKSCGEQRALETRELLLQAKGPALPSNHQRLDQEAALLWAAFQSSALRL